MHAAYCESSERGCRVFQAAISRTRTNLLPTALTMVNTEQSVTSPNIQSDDF